MAPLGIITALVGAIRVGGPTWLKAVVGRARETRASAEVELMSSTSHEVCELWNGEAIVRTMGEPIVQQIVYLENCPEDFGLYTCSIAERKRMMKHGKKGQSRELGVLISNHVAAVPIQITKDRSPKSTNTLSSGCLTSLMEVHLENITSRGKDPRKKLQKMQKKPLQKLRSVTYERPLLLQTF
jgi:hypothetical protein